MDAYIEFSPIDVSIFRILGQYSEYVTPTKIARGVSYMDKQDIRENFVPRLDCLARFGFLSKHQGKYKLTYEIK